MKKITIGIVAHVDAGKTTCIESMLFHAGVIRKAGRVDHKDTVMDFDEQERGHGITIYSKEAHFTWKDADVYVIDTPGHVDFSSEMEKLDDELEKISQSGEALIDSRYKKETRWILHISQKMNYWKILENIAAICVLTGLLVIKMKCLR